MAGIYHNATLGVISLSSDGSNWITIADKNLGATSTDVTSQNSFGKYYQRGNNYGYYYGNTVSLGSTVDASNYGPDNYYSSSNFVKNYLWDSSNNGNLRGGVTGTNTARKGPCDTGFHVPSRQDYASLINSMSSLGLTVTNETAFITYLFFPRPGYWNYGNGSWNPIFGTDNYTRISDYYSDGAAYSFRYASNISNYNTANYEGFGLNIRPFKDEPVIPYAYEGWTKLYGDDLPPRPEPPLPKLKWLVNTGNYYYFKDAPTHASAISLNKSSITLTEAGQTEQLVATITPSDAVDKKVIWSSSNTSIATVSSTGLVTCVTPGSATITATCADGGASATCDVAEARYVEFLLVGGGGYGGRGKLGGSGGGGGGGVIECNDYVLENDITQVTIGTGGVAEVCSATDSCFGNYVAYAGGSGGGETDYQCFWAGDNGGSGGGGSGNCNGGTGYTGQGYKGGKGCRPNGGGGGGASQAGRVATSQCGGYGGAGIESSISGTATYYGSGGSGGSCASYSRPGMCGGGCGGRDYCNGGDATVYGGGGGGGGGCHCCGQYTSTTGGSGCQGVFIVRYKTGDYNLGGGTKYTCGDYTIHCFTKSGYLFNGASGKHMFEYIAVGGGAGGNYAGGGGGQVLVGGMEATNNSYCIVIGTGGNCGVNGGNTCIGTLVAKGGCTSSDAMVGGTSGSGCAGGANCSSARGGGGGAKTNGVFAYNGCCGGYGGRGICGYGGGGGGYGSCYGGDGYDGGGNGKTNCNATNCGGGGGYVGNGAAGIVKICYPADGGYGFTCATGGTKTLEDGMCVHTFTSNGTFTIVS